MINRTTGKRRTHIHRMSSRTHPDFQSCVSPCPYFFGRWLFLARLRKIFTSLRDCYRFQIVKRETRRICIVSRRSIDENTHLFHLSTIWEWPTPNNEKITAIDAFKSRHQNWRCQKEGIEPLGKTNFLDIRIQLSDQVKLCKPPTGLI